jgi:hypothetical protein
LPALEEIGFSNAFMYRIILILSILIPSAYARLWTDQFGRTVEAEFKSVSNGTVILVKPSGQAINLSLRSLSLADRKYVSEHPTPSEQPTPGETAPPKKTKTGVHKVELLVAESSHPGAADQKIQDLSIHFGIDDAKIDSAELKIYFVAGPSDGMINALGIRSGAYSNGQVSHLMEKDHFQLANITAPISRFANSVFLGYRIELWSGSRLLDMHAWSNAEALGTLNQRLSLPENWWYDPAFLAKDQ